MLKNLCISEPLHDRVLEVIVKGIFKKRMYVYEAGKLKEIK